jgi:hypothetical protein
MGAQGLDLELRNVVCDESLPAYISKGDISWTCSDGGTACSMGDGVVISGGSKCQSRLSFLYGQHPMQ